MKTMTELREQLCAAFEDVRDKKLEPKHADVMVNAAGKIIGTAALQMKYHAQNKTKANIPFMK